MDQDEIQKYCKILQEIHTPSTGKPRKLNLEDEKVLEMLIPILMKISFARSWNEILSIWFFGSWLDSDIATVFSKAKEKFGKTIYEYLDEFGRNKTYGEWKNVMAEYPLLPIKCYKQEIDFELENIKSILPIENEFGRKAWIDLNQEWLKTIVRKVSFPDGTSFKDKFSAYLTSEYFPIALKSHFGNNLKEEESKEFTKLFSEQNESIQIKIREAMKASNSKFWKRFGKKF